MSLEGKVAIVTGASQGIGQAIAERLGRDGAKVVVGHLDDPEKAERVVRSIESTGGQATAIAVDVRRTDAILRLFDETLGRWGHADIVVANAGVNMNRPVVDTTEDDFDRIFSVNARGTFFVFREAAKRVGDGGRIIGVSTNMTLQARPGIALYAASKAAVEQFVKVLARELGSRRINVN